MLCVLQRNDGTTKQVGIVLLSRSVSGYSYDFSFIHVIPFGWLSSPTWESENLYYRDEFAFHTFRMAPSLQNFEIFAFKFLGNYKFFFP